MKGAYYNENDKFAAAWLRELIKAGLIAPGEVDERSIEDVQASDLRGFTQCHFFAGIGVWSYALRNAGWSDDSPVWTGSCPCQSFSASGKGEGFSDKRHLWPAWFRLISECRPHTIFGEQVAAKAGLAWLDVVSADLEGTGYAIGTADLCAASVGAPHIRQRLFFVANTSGERVRTTRFGSVDEATRGMQTKTEQRKRLRPDAGKHCDVVSGSDPKRNGRRADIAGRETQGRAVDGRDRETGDCPNSNGGNAGAERIQRSGKHGLCEEDSRIGERPDARFYETNIEGTPRSAIASGNESPNGIPSRDGCGVGNDLNAEQSGLERLSGDVRDWRGPGWLDPITARSVAAAGATRGFWQDCDWWYGRDGKYRPIGAGLFPLVTGASNRMVKLRGYGNALNAQVAQAFIEAYLEAASGRVAA